MIQSFKFYFWQVVEYWQGVDLVFDFAVGVSLLILNHPVLGSEDVVLFEFYNVRGYQHHLGVLSWVDLLCLEWAES